MSQHSSLKMMHRVGNKVQIGNPTGQYWVGTRLSTPILDGPFVDDLWLQYMPPEAKVELDRMQFRSLEDVISELHRRGWQLLSVQHHAGGQWSAQTDTYWFARSGEQEDSK